MLAQLVTILKKYKYEIVITKAKIMPESDLS